MARRQRDEKRRVLGHLKYAALSKAAGKNTLVFENLAFAIGHDTGVDYFRLLEILEEERS